MGASRKGARPPPEAEAEGMVKMDGEMVNATFDAATVDVPLGFKPSTEEGILDQGIRLISPPILARAEKRSSL